MDEKGSSSPISGLRVSSTDQDMPLPARPATLTLRDALPGLTLGILDRDLLEGSRVGKTGDQSECRLTDPGPDPVDKGKLPKRPKDRLLINELLHFFEDCGAFCLVELVSLLRIQLVDIGIAAINVS